MVIPDAIGMLAKGFQYLESYETMTRERYAKLNEHDRLSFRMYLLFREYTERVSGNFEESRSMDNVILSLLPPVHRERIIATKGNERLEFLSNKGAANYFGCSANKVAAAVRYSKEVNGYTVKKEVEEINISEMSLLSSLCKHKT